MTSRPMPAVFGVIASLCVQGCTTHLADKPRAKDAGCDATSFPEVFSNPSQYFGKTFCGYVMAVPTERILPVYPVGEVPPTRDTVGFFDVKTDRRIRILTQSKSGPVIVYVRAKINGSEECFDPNSGVDCVPFKHSFTLNVLEFSIQNNSIEQD